MSTFQRGLGNLAEQQAKADKEREERAQKTVTPDELAGAKWKEGTRVKDTVTGGFATVTKTFFQRVLTPAKEIGMFPIPDSEELEVVIITTDDGHRLARNPAELARLTP